MHGAKSRPHVIIKDSRTLELAEQIRSVIPVRSPADEFAVEALSIALVRTERAAAALEQLDAELEDEGPLGTYVRGSEQFNADSLRKDLRGWLTTIERFCAALGLTPSSRAKLGLDLARTRQLTMVEWHEQAALEQAAG